MALAIINLPLSASLQTTSASSALVSVLVELFFFKRTCVIGGAAYTSHQIYKNSSVTL